MADTNDPVSGENSASRMAEAMERLTTAAPMEGAAQPVLAEEPASEATSEPTSIIEAWEADKLEAVDSLPDESSEDSELSASSDSDDSPDPSEATEELKADGDIEEVLITDAKGRRKVKVDFSDKDKLRRYVKLAAGARKWQAERDSAKTEYSSLKTEYDGLKDDWNKLETAYSKSGVAGLIDLLEGRDGAYDDWFGKQVTEYQSYQDMTDDERSAFDQHKLAQKQERENQRLKQEYQEELDKIKKERETAELRSVEAKLHPSFDRYRFQGKLGDDVAEHRLDSALWSQALKELESIPDDVELTKAIVDKTFRKVSNEFKKLVSTQSEKRTKQSIKKTKENATRRAQAKVGKTLQRSEDVEDFKKQMRSGNIVDGITSFFKAGGNFS